MDKPLGKPKANVIFFCAAPDIMGGHKLPGETLGEVPPLELIHPAFVIAKASVFAEATPRQVAVASGRRRPTGDLGCA